MRASEYAYIIFFWIKREEKLRKSPKIYLIQGQKLTTNKAHDL